MRRLALALLCLTSLGFPGLAWAQPQPSGRYHVTATAGSPPVIVMHDTGTGQSWVLVQTPGGPGAVGAAALLGAGEHADGAAADPSTVGIPPAER